MMKTTLSLLLALVTLACVSESELASVELEAAAQPPITCGGDEDCPPSQTCENYDCEGAPHCVQPGQGGFENCCATEASCKPGYACVESVLYQTGTWPFGVCERDEAADCSIRFECGGQCETSGVAGACALMSNGDCACVPLA